MIRSFILLILAIGFALPAQAAPIYQYSGWGNVTITPRHHVRPHRHTSHLRHARQAQHRHTPAGAHEGGALAHLNVAPSAAANFQGLVAEFAAMGYAIGTPGCLSGGHMAHSKHHWGGACDLFNQVARNRTALPMPPAHVQIAVAARHGLTSGCVWRNQDCGHFEVNTRYAGLHGAYAAVRSYMHRAVLYTRHWRPWRQYRWARWT